ncbi:hypothetical protein ACQUSR_15710 [Streptomyces sp. P1-3]|uniref:hypothetical protein n=1 Tax=Streptomyces sp. P1-3 TaxID=3421658 RepID=UPI003D36F1EA
MITRKLIDSVAAWSWLETTEVGTAAFVLMARPEPDERMAALADGMGLVTPRRRLPSVGPRVVLRGLSYAAVRVDGCDHAIGVLVGERWSRFVAGGGPVVLMAGLRPLRRGATRDEVDAYVAAATIADRIRLGIAHARGVR